jgi:hypothetical protein
MDRRGVSSAITYALVITITLTLTAGLLFGTESLIQQNREQTAVEQMEVVEQRVATTVETTYRLAESSSPDPSPERVRVTRELPDRLAGSQYHIELEDPTGDAARIEVELVEFDAATETTVRLEVEFGDPDFSEASVNGGDIAVVYDPGDNEVTIRNV